ncbi:major facilitator superfamily domain-containing protein 6-B isoform X2 [Penaeus vannamei]|uniref:major facilitator superfamily domain-containing protein 6-B isoform X2 n=1 Tax=Penaeus vannamei TaxID=6689 RepID=UPI000F6683BC|nr:major facilitator superfamily domain-containing protein 6-B-like isoform X2 [Penaeus vannamei]
MSFTKGLRRFWDDLLTLKLVVLKIIYFFLLAAIVILWSQFTIHQEAIGLTKYQTGIVGSVMSAVTIVVSLLGGIVGDKLGNYKVILSISTVMAGVSSLLFTFVPPAEPATFWVYMIVRVCFGMIFYLSTGLHIITGGLMTFLNMDFKIPARTISKQIFKHLANVEVLMFLGAMLATGMFIGYIETFMYRYLFDLGASQLLIGLTVTVGAPFELVFTLVAASVVAKVGHAHVIMLGLLAYSVRLLGFSFLSNPWWSLPLEILESVANGLMFPAGILYCTVLFPLETITSSRGVFGMSYFGIGKLVGTIVGSEIRELAGDVQTYRWLSGAAFVTSVLYCIGFAVLTTKRSKKAVFPPLTPSKDNPGQGGIDNLALEAPSAD